MSLATRLELALAKRLFPCSSLGPKQLAHALGIDPVTLWRYRTARVEISGEVLVALVEFFRNRGDYAFESEVMPNSTSVLRPDLSATGPQQPNNPTPPIIRLVSGAGRDIIDEHATAPRRHQLLAPGLVVGPVSTEAGGASSQQPWRVERLSLDSLGHPTAQELASLASSESDLMQAADNAGVLRECGLFRITQSEVINLQIGRSSQMRPAIRNAMLGLPVDRWPDRPYAEVVKEHVLEANKSGPSYHYLDGTVHGIHAPYRRSIFPAGEGFVVSFTERMTA